MSYLVTGTKLNRPLRTKTNRDSTYPDCQATRPKTITRWARDEATAERILLDLVERDIITYGTYEEV